jgi:hypothetical protein
MTAPSASTQGAPTPDRPAPHDLPEFAASMPTPRELARMLEQAPGVLGRGLAPGQKCRLHVFDVASRSDAVVAEFDDTIFEAPNRGDWQIPLGRRMRAEDLVGGERCRAGRPARKHPQPRRHGRLPGRQNREGAGLRPGDAAVTGARMPVPCRPRRPPRRRRHQGGDGGGQRRRAFLPYAHIGQRPLRDPCRDRHADDAARPTPCGTRSAMPLARAVHDTRAAHRVSGLWPRRGT